jgi:hypothetical protein
VKNNQEIATGKNDIDQIADNDQRVTSAQSINKKKDRVKRSRKRNKKSSSTCDGEDISNDNTSYSIQLANKLKWAVDEV